MSNLSAEETKRLVAGVRRWHHVIAFPHGISSPGAYDPRDLWARLGLTDLRNQRVLDVGARDGFFAFECEKLGAEVVAVDHQNSRHTGFDVAKTILGSKLDCMQANVYELTPQQLGKFDLILFLGVIYHLRHPLLALDRLRALCKGQIMVESLVCDSGVFTGYEQMRPLADLAPELEAIPVAQFLPAGRFHRDWTNKWVPNISCLQALIADALFAPEETQCWGDRALVRATVEEDPVRRRRLETDAGLAG